MNKYDSLYSSLAAMFAGLLLSFVIHNAYNIPNIYSDFQTFYQRAWVTNGTLPYVTEPFEYPPVSGFILYFSRILGHDFTGTYNVLGALTILSGLVVVWATWMVARQRGRDLKPFYFILPSVVIYGVYNFDLFHVMFVMLSLMLMLRGNRLPAALMLGLAISTKITSGVLLPVYLIQIREKKGIAKFLLVLLAVVGAINLPLIAINFGNWLQTYTFLSNWGLEDAWFVWIFPNPSTWFYAKIFGFSIMGILLLRVYTLKAEFVAKAFLTLAAYLLGTYIYSPQFNLLLIPLLAILAVDHPSLFLWDVFNGLIIITWFIGYDQPGWAPTIPPSYAQFFALMRTVMLVVMVFAFTRREGWNLYSLLPHRGQKTLDAGLSPYTGSGPAGPPAQAEAAKHNVVVKAG